MFSKKISRTFVHKNGLLYKTRTLVKNSDIGKNTHTLVQPRHIGTNKQGKVKNFKDLYDDFIPLYKKEEDLYKAFFLHSPIHSLSLHNLVV